MLKIIEIKEVISVEEERWQNVSGNKQKVIRPIPKFLCLIERQDSKEQKYEVLDVTEIQPPKENRTTIDENNAAALMKWVSSIGTSATKWAESNKQKKLENDVLPFKSPEFKIYLKQKESAEGGKKIQEQPAFQPPKAPEPAPQEAPPKTSDSVDNTKAKKQPKQQEAQAVEAKAKQPEPEQTTEHKTKRANVQIPSDSYLFKDYAKAEEKVRNKDAGIATKMIRETIDKLTENGFNPMTTEDFDKMTKKSIVLDTGNWDEPNPRLGFCVAGLLKALNDKVIKLGDTITLGSDDRLWTFEFQYAVVDDKPNKRTPDSVVVLFLKKPKQIWNDNFEKGNSSRDEGCLVSCDPFDIARSYYTYVKGGKNPNTEKKINFLSSGFTKDGISLWELCNYYNSDVAKIIKKYHEEQKVASDEMAFLNAQINKTTNGSTNAHPVNISDDEPLTKGDVLTQVPKPQPIEASPKEDDDLTKEMEKKVEDMIPKKTKTEAEKAALIEKHKKEMFSELKEEMKSDSKIAVVYTNMFRDFLKDCIPEFNMGIEETNPKSLKDALNMASKYIGGVVTESNSRKRKISELEAEINATKGNLKKSEVHAMEIEESYSAAIAEMQNENKKLKTDEKHHQMVVDNLHSDIKALNLKLQLALDKHKTDAAVIETANFNFHQMQTTVVELQLKYNQLQAASNGISHFKSEVRKLSGTIMAAFEALSTAADQIPIA